jgi:hypothetical protein
MEVRMERWHRVLALAILAGLWLALRVAAAAPDVPVRYTRLYAAAPAFSVPQGDVRAVAASAQGRYLALAAQGQHAGIWVGQRRTGRWRKLSNHPAQIAWLPDERGMVVVMRGPQEGLTASRVTFYRLPVQGPAVQLATATRLLDWQLIPDASGIVITRTDTPRAHEPTVAVEVFAFATRRWRTVHVEPSRFYDGTPGTSLALRRHGDAWILSYTEGMTGDNSGLWVNLATGKVQRAHEGAYSRLRFSPDGRYALDGPTLYAARSWPVLDRHKTYGRGLGARLRTLATRDGYAHWSPDGRHIAATMPAGCAVFDLAGKQQDASTADLVGWAGPRDLLLWEDSILYLRGIHDRVNKAVCRVAWRAPKP